MTKQSRRIIFWLAVLAFVVSVPIVTSYAQGYRFDFKNLAFTRVGAILLESKPKDATVYINNKNSGKQTAVILGNLLPSRKYAVRIEKDGFYTWQKELSVAPEKITSAKNIYLFPKELDFEELEFDGKFIASEKFSVSPDTDSVFIANRKLDLYILEVKTGLVTLINFPDLLLTRGLDNISWSKNSDSLLFRRRTRLGHTWHVYDKGDETLTNITLLYEKNLFLTSPSQKPLPEFFETNSVLFFNNSGTRLVTIIEEKILLLDTRRESLSMLGVGDAKEITTYKGDIFVFASPDILFKIDETNEEPILLGNLRFEPEELIVSPDGDKLLFFHGFTVGVVWLSDTFDEPIKKLGQQDIVFQPINPIKKLSWHSSGEYVIALLESGEFVIVELDIRDKQNIWTWDFKDTGSFDYTEQEKFLFVQKKDGTLLRHLGDF